MDGETLRNMRVEAGIKAKELASAMGIADATLSRYENGHKEVPKLVQLAARYLCEKNTTGPSAPTLSDLAITAIKEAIDGQVQVMELGSNSEVA